MTTIIWNILCNRSFSNLSYLPNLESLVADSNGIEVSISSFFHVLKLKYDNFIRLLYFPHTLPCLFCLLLFKYSIYLFYFWHILLYTSILAIYYCFIFYLKVYFLLLVTMLFLKYFHRIIFDYCYECMPQSYSKKNEKLFFSLNIYIPNKHYKKHYFFIFN